MKKITYLILCTCIYFSCNSQKKNIIDSKIQSRETMQNKITVKDLEKSKPIIIKTEKGYEEVYSVIIYTEDSDELTKHDVIVQSVSKNFLTALIKKDQLDAIYKLKSVKSISLPQMSYIEKPIQDFKKME